MRELPIPPDAKTAGEAIEVARGWIVDEKLQCSLFPTIWAETPEVWGILLADLASHVSNAIASESGMSRDQVYRIISKRLVDELKLPSAEHTGNFVDWDDNSCD